MSREQDVEFLEKSLKVDTSLVHSLEPQMESKDASPTRKLPPLIQAQTPLVPSTADHGTPERALWPIPESTFNLETDFFSAPKTKMPRASFRDDMTSRHKSLRSRRETKEVDVQTDLRMLTREGKQKTVGFDELSMMDLPSVGGESRDTGGRLPSVGTRIATGAVDLRKTAGASSNDYMPTSTR